MSKLDTVRQSAKLWLYYGHVNISTGSSSDSQSSATTIRLSSSGRKHDLLWGLNVGDYVCSPIKLSSNIDQVHTTPRTTRPDIHPDQASYVVVNSRCQNTT